MVHAELNAFSRFDYAIKTEETRRKYFNLIEVFFDFSKFKGKTIQDKAKSFMEFTKDNDLGKVTDLILNYMSFHISRANKKEISKGTVRNFYKPIKLFCDMNSIIFNSKLVTKGFPAISGNSSDRIPTIQEIQEVLKYPDRRIKPILLTMISSGIRVGAWEYLKWKHIIPQYGRNRNIIAAKIIVYEGEPEEYFSFITPEAYYALKEWIEFRSSQGEKVSRESWVMRDLWNTGHILINSKESNLKKGTYGFVSVPKKAETNAIRQIFTRSWKVQNVRPAGNKIKRHEFKSTHSLRKFFETHAMKSMNLLNVKLLMGHDIGLDKSYFKPTPEVLLEDYVENGLDVLTINQEFRLKREVIKLKQREDELDRMRIEHKKEMKAMRKEMELKLGKILAKIDVKKLN